MNISTGASQPNGVRLVVLANILLWGIHIPILQAGLVLQFLLTIFTGLRAGAMHRPLTIKIYIFLAVLILYGAGTYLFGPCTDQGVKFAASLVMMVIMVASLKWTASTVHWDAPLLTIRDASTMLGLMTTLATIEFIIKFLSGTPLAEIRAAGIYLEPSHLALSAAPLILYLWFCGASRTKFFVAISTFILFVVAHSSTLIIILSVFFIIPFVGRLFKRPYNLYAIFSSVCLLASLLFIAAISITEDTIIRFNDIIDLRAESNVSSLVYANGWQLLNSYLTSTNGFGLGFNAMGCDPRSYTEATDWLELLQLGEQNFNDGSFLFSKLGSELGYAGIIFFVSLTVYSLHGLLFLSSMTTKPIFVLAIGWLAVATFGGFIRSGGGYFSGPAILGIFSFLILQNQRRRRFRKF